MSNYGQQPAYGSNPYGQPPHPYGQPLQPYGRPAQQPPYPQPPYPETQQPYPGPPNSGQPNRGQPNQYAPPQPPPYAPSGPGQPQGQPTQGYGQPTDWQAQPPVPARPGIVQRSTIVVTMDAVPGREITAVLGDVVGVVARSRELPRELRTPNPVEGYAVVLTQSRQDAVTRLTEMAQAAGADAVVGLRFDSSEITQSLSEIVAYGTAVSLAPVADELDDTTARTGASALEPDREGRHRGGPTDDEAGGTGTGPTPDQTTSTDQANSTDQATRTDPAATSPGQWPPSQSWPPPA